jgi:type III secretion protein L
MPVLDLKPQRPVGAIVRACDLPLWVTGNGYLEAAKEALRDLERELPGIVAEERGRGYEEGWDAGSRDAIGLLARIKTEVDAYYRRLNQEVTDLVIEITRHIIGEMMPSDVVYAAVSKALDTLDPRAELTLYVAPQVFDEVRNKLAAALDSATQSKLALRQDPNLSPSDSRLVSEFGMIDLSVERQLEILASSFRSAGIGIQS